MDEAILQGLAETTTPGIWLEDFLKAIANPLTQLASRFDTQITSQDDNIAFRGVTGKIRQTFPRLIDAGGGPRNFSYLRPRQPRRSDERPTDYVCTED
jgi:hypothetical protein